MSPEEHAMFFALAILRVRFPWTEERSNQLIKCSSYTNGSKTYIDDETLFDLINDLPFSDHTDFLLNEDILGLALNKYKSKLENFVPPVNSIMLSDLDTKSLIIFFERKRP